MHREKRRFAVSLVTVVLVIFYVAIRLLHLDLFVTTDEPFWLGRSANFYRALAQRDFAYTYQMAHPGILTMWAGTIAYIATFSEYARDVHANLDFAYGIDLMVRELGHDPMRLLIAARISKIIMQALLFAISLVFLARLFGGWVMAICGALLVFDPFVSGMDSLLHVDGLFTITSFAAVLALAAAVRARPDAMAPWIVAGALAGCAWMTRATGLAIAPVVVTIVLGMIVIRWRHRGSRSVRSVLESPVFGINLWLAGAGVVSLLVLPALWVDPFGVMQRVWDWSKGAAIDGHERPSFFMGDIFFGDPGLAFYPVTLALRLTPFVIFGAAVCLILMPQATRAGWLCRARTQSLAIIVAFAVVYAGLMTLGAKKFDRYILPVYPVVFLLAAVGIVLLARRLIASRPGWGRVALPLVAGIVIAGQAGSLATSLPYRLDYFNPLLGGLAQAQTMVQVGWGEGGGAAMEFIIADADGRDVLVQKSSATPVLSYFATSNVLFDDIGLDTPAGWYETDYFVGGIQQWQRDMSPGYLLLQEYEPVDVVRIHGVPFFKTYKPRELPLPDSVRVPTDCSATFGDRVELAQIVGRERAIDLYWVNSGDEESDLELLVTLFPPEGSGQPLTVPPARFTATGAGRVSKATLADPRQGEAPSLAEYTLSVQLRDPATGTILPVAFEGNPVDDNTFITRSGCYDS